MKRPDLAAGFVLVGLGIYIIQQSRLLTYRDEFGPGPGLLPFWLGVLLTVLASCVVVSSLRGRFGNGGNGGIRGQTPFAAGIPLNPSDPRQREGSDPLFPHFPHSRISRALLAWLSLIATVAALEVLGFFLSFGLLSFFLVYVIEQRSFSGAIAVSVAITLGFLLLFRVILPVPVPLNPWGF